MAALFGLLLCACPHQVEAPLKASSPSGATMVQLKLLQDDSQAAPPHLASERDQVFDVLAKHQAEASSCYQAAVKRDPYAYGEVVVRFSIDEGGRPEQVETVLATIGDQTLVSCVEGLVESLRFSAPSGGQLVVRYPFVFTSDLTPTEVVRALQQHHGMLEEVPANDDIRGGDENPKSPGTVVTW